MDDKKRNYQRVAEALAMPLDTIMGGQQMVPNLEAPMDPDMARYGGGVDPAVMSDPTMQAIESQALAQQAQASQPPVGPPMQPPMQPPMAPPQGYQQPGPIGPNGPMPLQAKFPGRPRF